MSNELIPFGQQTTSVSADIFASIFNGVATLEKRFIERFPTLSFNGSKFHCVVGGDKHTIRDEDDVPVSSLDVIVVGIPEGRANVLYNGYDPENPAPPLCRSVNGKTPDKDILEPKNHNCQVCEMKVKVPKKQTDAEIARGAPVKMAAPCEPKMYFAVVIRGQEDKIYKMALSITGIYDTKTDGKPFMAWDQYSDWLRKNGVMHPAMVVTRISFDSDVSHVKPVFKAVGHLTQEMLASIAPAIQSTITREIVTGSPEQLGTGEARPALENKPAELPKPTEVPTPAPTEAPTEAPKPAVNPEAEIRSKIEAQVRAEMAAKLAAEAQAAAKPAEPAPEPTEAQKKATKAKAVVVESDAALDDALSDW